MVANFYYFGSWSQARLLCSVPVLTDLFLYSFQPSLFIFLHHQQKKSHTKLLCWYTTQKLLYRSYTPHFEEKWQCVISLHSQLSFPDRSLVVRCRSIPIFLFYLAVSNMVSASVWVEFYSPHEGFISDGTILMVSTFLF